jgi:hypothetical protein
LLELFLQGELVNLPGEVDHSVNKDRNSHYNRGYTGSYLCSHIDEYTQHAEGVIRFTDLQLL